MSASTLVTRKPASRELSAVDARLDAFYGNTALGQLPEVRIANNCVPASSWEVSRPGNVCLAQGVPRDL